MSVTDWELIDRYVRTKADDAFAELVRRHLGVVYGVALRQLRSTQLAEEAAQAAFIDLAGQAATLKPNTISRRGSIASPAAKRLTSFAGKPAGKPAKKLLLTLLL